MKPVLRVYQRDKDHGCWHSIIALCKRAPEYELGRIEKESET